MIWLELRAEKCQTVSPKLATSPGMFRVSCQPGTMHIQITKRAYLLIINRMGSSRRTKAPVCSRSNGQ
jgi:hypothetical protein